MNAIERMALSVLRPPMRLAERATIRVFEAALARAMEGPLVEAVARDLGRYEVIERAVAQMLADGEVERIVAAAMESPAAARIGDRVLDSPEAERLVARVIESRLVDEAVARLLESEDLWLMIDVIARSPAVTEAISQQGRGFAAEMAGVVRDRSEKADASVERIARRLLRRGVADGHDA
jgi:hypothetical protein